MYLFKFRNGYYTMIFKIKLVIISLILMVLLPDICFSIEIKATAKNIYNTAGNIELLYEIIYNRKFEEIDYLKSEINKKSAVDFIQHITNYKSFINNSERQLREYDIFVYDKFDYDQSIDGDIVTDRFTYTIKSFETIDLYIKPLNIVYHRGNTALDIQTPAIPVFIKDIKLMSSPTGDFHIKDIKGPFAEKDYTAIIIIIAVSGIIVLITAILIISRIRNRTHTIDAPVYKSPYERAVDSLNELRDTPQYKSGDGKYVYTRISLIIRLYLSEVFALPIMESTTSHIVSLLKDEMVDGSLPFRVGSILSECDLVKYAKNEVSSEKLKEDTGKAYYILHELRSQTAKEENTTEEIPSKAVS